MRRRVWIDIYIIKLFKLLSFYYYNPVSSFYYFSVFFFRLHNSTRRKNDIKVVFSEKEVGVTPNSSGCTYKMFLFFFLSQFRQKTTLIEQYFSIHCKFFIVWNIFNSVPCRCGPKVVSIASTSSSNVSIQMIFKSEKKNRYLYPNYLLFFIWTC